MYFSNKVHILFLQMQHFGFWIRVFRCHFFRGIFNISPDSLSKFLPPMLLFYRLGPIFLCLPGILFLPFVSLCLQINMLAPETWVICVIHHNEQHPFLRLHYRFAPPTPQTNLCSGCVIMLAYWVKWSHGPVWFIEFSFFKETENLVSLCRINC